MVEKDIQIKNSLLYLVPVMIGNLMPIITLPIFTRILTKYDFGLLALSQIYAIFMTGVANFGMKNIYNRNFFHYDDKDSCELLYSVMIFVIISMIFFGILTYIFMIPISNLLIRSTHYGHLIFFSYCSLGMMSVNYYFLNYFKNSENARKFVIFSVIESILIFTLSLFLVAFLKIGVVGIILGQLASRTILFLIIVTVFLKVYPIAFNFQMLKESLKLGIPLTPRIFFGVISSQFDKYMLGLLSSVGGVGIYSIGQKLSTVVFTYMTSLQNVFQPQVYKQMFDSEEHQDSVGPYLTPFAYISVAVAFFIAIFAEEIVIIMMPESYYEAINIIIVLCMFYASMFFGKQPQLIFKKKTSIVSILTIFGILFNVILNIPFILKWGAIGAAWATFLAGIISGLISFIVSQHYYEIKWKYKKIGAIYLIFFTSAILMIILRNISVAYEIRLLLKFIAMAMYFFLGVKLRVITLENFMLIKNMILLRKATTSDQI